MTINIPPVGGIPGIPGPPDWLNLPPTGSYDLDDVRWLGAIKRSFGAGGAGSNSFRAAQAVVGTQQFIYLSFRAAFVPSLSDQYDKVYLGLQRTSGTKAMVVQMQVHGSTFNPAGPPSTFPPANLPLGSVKIWTRNQMDTSWSIQTMAPSWIAAKARVWLHPADPALPPGTPPPPGYDPNNRWAIELLIPAATTGDIADDTGPNLGSDFELWYVMHGTFAGNMPVFLADSRTDFTSHPTSEGDLLNEKFPVPFGTPSLWDEYVLTSGPGTNGGVAIFGNGFTDIVVQNRYGESTKIENGKPNIFVARPRNYTGVSIPAGDISATFRMANWGSVGGDPNQVDWATGTWDYVPGNDALHPMISSLPIPVLPAGNPSGDPIALSTNITLGADKSLHQCILVTLSGTTLTFLTTALSKT